MADRPREKERAAETIHPPNAAKGRIFIGKQAENSRAATGHPASQRAVFEHAFPDFSHHRKIHRLFQHIFKKRAQCGKVLFLHCFQCLRRMGMADTVQRVVSGKATGGFNALRRLGNHKPAVFQRRQRRDFFSDRK